MRSDDELLSHIRQQAGVRRQRRQRALAGAAVAAVALLLGVGALAATGDDSETVKAEDGPSTTTTEAPTTTEVPSTIEASTTTSTTSTTTTTTTAPTTTEPPPTTTEAPPTTTEPEAIAPVVQTASADGLTVTFTTYRDPARPRWVRIDARYVAARGSGAWMRIDWLPPDGEHRLYGDVPVGLGEPECDGGGWPPDPHAAAVDVTVTAEYTYAEGAPITYVEPVAGISHCTDDARSVSHRIDLPPVG